MPEALTTLYLTDLSSFEACAIILYQALPLLWRYSLSLSLCVCVCACVCVLAAQSCPTLCNPMDCSPQVPLSMEFSWQEYWSRLPFPSPGDLLNPGIKPSFPVPPALQANSLPSEPPGKPEWLYSLTSK